MWRYDITYITDITDGYDITDTDTSDRRLALWWVGGCVHEIVPSIEVLHIIILI